MKKQTYWMIGVLLDDSNWMAEGLFLSELGAASACRVDQFIVEVELGMFPKTALDAIKLYWPKKETWETSTLYKHRNKVA
jgi:hypothetical protein